MTEPNRYLKPRRYTPPAQASIIYTCPMHPQIRRTEPGNCPICGMALEPIGVAEESGRSPELVDMTRRFWIGTILSVPTVILEMGAHLPGLNFHRYVSPQLTVWLQFLLATPVVLWAGWPFFVRGWESVRNRSLNMFSLIALGVGAAYLYSLAATFVPGLFPAGLQQEGGDHSRLLRSRRCHHGARSPWTSFGTAGARADGQRHSCLAESCAENSTAHSR
jgi:Cu+-exporting ATPase